MAGKVYHINKGVNKPIEFKGLKAQYIWILGAIVVTLLVIFTILYFIGLSSGFCLIVTLVLLGISIKFIYHLSDKYGEYGLLKLFATRNIPKNLVINSNQIFKSKNNATAD